MLGLTFLSIKIVSLHRQEHGCSSELLRRNASDAGIEIKSIPAFQCSVEMKTKRNAGLSSYYEPGFTVNVPVVVMLYSDVLTSSIFPLSQYQHVT